MSQGSAVEIIFIYSNPSEQWLTFKGGQFSVQVTNTGNSTLQSVDIMIGFDHIQSVCGYRLVERRHFSGLSLEPGESTWRDFSDVSGREQFSNPWQFCFWTARPNEKPDANHDDDVLCHTVFVNVDEPEPAGLTVSPNPASDGFWVTTADNVQSPCNLFDYTGRLIQTTRIPAGETRFYIPTVDLPDGVYFLQLGVFVEKIMVRHDR